LFVYGAGNDTIVTPVIEELFVTVEKPATGGRLCTVCSNIKQASNSRKASNSSNVSNSRDAISSIGASERKVTECHRRDAETIQETGGMPTTEATTRGEGMPQQNERL
jgi:hypothetical protein